MIALAPKCYIFIEEDEKEIKKAKGISLGRNPQIDLQSYIDCLKENKIINATNVNLITHKFEKEEYSLVKIEQEKVALSTQVLNKMVTFPNHQSCAPIIFGLPPENYIEEI
jgi:hypothetical protein